MKITEKKKPIATVPKGVWEASHPLDGTSVNQKGEKTGMLSPATDLQGNGYPLTHAQDIPDGMDFLP